MRQAESAPTGALTNKVHRFEVPPFAPGHELSDQEILDQTRPHVSLPNEVNNWRAANAAKLVEAVQGLGVARAVAREHGLPYLWSQLWLRVHRAASDLWLPYGLADAGRQFTTVGAEYVVDAHQNIVELEIMNFHGIGTGSTAEAAADTDLVTDLPFLGFAG